MFSAGKRWVAARLRRAVGTDEIAEVLLTRLSAIERQMSVIEARLGTVTAIEAQFGAVSAGLRAGPAAIEAAEQRLHGRLDGVQHWVSYIVERSQRANRVLDTIAIDTDDRLRDLLALQMGAPPSRLTLHFCSERGVAEDSPDHTAPRGTAHDNTRHPRFVRRCEQLLPEIRHLDIGCAGGGLVWDFTIRGHLSVGVEGSDYSLRNQRAEWRTIPDRLFTADIRHAFGFRDAAGRPLLFNVITAWELFEHIPTADVDRTIGHIAANLAPDGILVCSIATFVDKDETTGVVYHPTVQPRGWWEERFAAHGLAPRQGLFAHRDFVRGSGNPRAPDWDASVTPEMGFHLVLGRV